MEAQLRIGCSGWVYAHWKGRFYPAKLPAKDWFDFYAQHFDTVEINNSFYRLPKPETFEGWRKRAPEGFRFAVKGSRFITHIKRLKDPEEGVKRFFDNADKLNGAAGPMLWQLAPSFQRDDERLAAFLRALPLAYLHTFEFRHKSWLAPEVYELLGEHRAALCIPDRPDLPKDIRCTTDWTYIRLHGSDHDNGNYSDEELATWAVRIRTFMGNGADVWAYFDNDQEGFAIENARTLRRLLLE
ncbi:MAG: DUF72 domain-containing protein [Chloroflexi bacterium]|nr:DUF72 domain-containing protein [Chloroflexota bacterium]